MLRKILFVFLMAGMLMSTCSCALLQKPIEKRTGFLNYLKQTESNIRGEDWDKAKASLAEAVKAWKKLKPLIQIDIDHDYVNSIEQDFIKLDAYIETKEKSNSLATILLVEDTWENIGSL